MDLFIEEIINHRDAGFLCFDSTDQTRSPRFRAQIRHRFGPGADEETLAEIQKTFPNSGNALIEWFRLSNGSLLFADLCSKTSAVRIFPLHIWEMKTTEQHEYNARMKRRSPPGFVFADVPLSDKCFYISPIEAGVAIHCDEDGPGTAPFANSFDAFLDLIFRDPIAFMIRLGSHTFYCDGVSNTRWVPQTYLPDIHASDVGKTADDLGSELMDNFLEQSKRKFIPRDDELHMARTIELLRKAVRRSALINEAVLEHVIRQIQAIDKLGLEFDRVFTFTDSYPACEQEAVLEKKTEVGNLLEGLLNKNQNILTELSSEKNLSKRLSLAHRRNDNFLEAIELINSLGYRTEKLQEAVSRVSERRPAIDSEKLARFDKRVMRWEEAKKKLVENYRWLVHDLIDRLQLEPEEALVDGGMKGLRKAVQKYEYTRGYDFPSYAIWWVKQGIHRANLSPNRA